MTDRSNNLYESPLSEVGSRGPNLEETSGGTAGQSNASSESASILTNMEALLSRLLAATQCASTNSVPHLVKFDPDETDSDIEGWCKITEIIVDSRKLDGPELLLSLTHALKGRAAKCLTQLSSSEITGGNRVYKYAHETLRLVPKGFDGLVDVANCLLIDDEMAETAVDGECTDHITHVDDNSDTLSISSEGTLTASSGTLSASDTEQPFRQIEVESHVNENDSVRDY